MSKPTTEFRNRPIAELVEAVPDDVDHLLHWVSEFHKDEGVDVDINDRRRGIAELLQHPEYGRILWLKVDQETVGYVVLCFGYSLEFCGRDAFVDELFVCQQRRGQGIGCAAMRLLQRRCLDWSLEALHLEVRRDNRGARKLYGSLGFVDRANHRLMSCRLRDETAHSATQRDD